MASLPIHLAARSGDAAALRRELDNGVSPDAAAPVTGMTSLHWLCGGFRGGDRVACVNLLIDRGANVNVAHRHRARPLHYAVNNHPELVQMLLDAGADPNATVDDDSTVLHLALRSRLTGRAVVQALLSAGADVNLRDNSGKTPLDSAQLPEYLMDKVLPIMFRAGAALPPGNNIAYMRKIRHAMGL